MKSEQIETIVCVMMMTASLVAVAEPVRVASPDGRNVIRLWTDRLGYEVSRDGAVLVPRTDIGMTVGGRRLSGAANCRVIKNVLSGRADAPVYKKSQIRLDGRSAFADFGDWGVRLVARDDGVGYRFETRMPGRIRVDGETASVTLPDGTDRCWANRTGAFGREASRPISVPAKDLRTSDDGPKDFKGHSMVYLPFACSVGGKALAVTESDARDYPVWNLVRPAGAEGNILESRFAGWPKSVVRVAGWNGETTKTGGRWVKVTEHESYLVETTGTRTFPWRVFIPADDPSKFCESDIVQALSEPRAAGDFSWVRPGLVAWDWWNCFDNKGDAGCTTRTYERFVDFAAANGIPYVILDEGWSERLDIWRFNKAVDVPHLIDYANKKGVGLILWLAWAQAYGEEEKVVEHFAKLGAKGFKVDFIDRGDAESQSFVERFAAACARHRMVVDYHGCCRPTGLERKYPNILNYEAVHGLEHMKWFDGRESEMLRNDIAAFFLRQTAGPMDYTPGAMLNYAPGTGYTKDRLHPGSIGTRSRQMAMMVLYEAPLQMLCDSPTNYEANRESFSFMAQTPTVWADTVGLAGSPDGIAVVARRAKDGSWFVGGITGPEACEYELDTRFLGNGPWAFEAFHDATDSNRFGMHYEREEGTVAGGVRRLKFQMAPGGGFVVRFKHKTRAR